MDTQPQHVDGKAAYGAQCKKATSKKIILA